LIRGEVSMPPRKWTIGTKVENKNGGIYTILDTFGSKLLMSCDVCTKRFPDYTFTTTNSNIHKTSCLCSGGNSLIDRPLMNNYFTLNEWVVVRSEDFHHKKRSFETILYKVGDCFYREVAIGKGYSTLLDEDFFKNNLDLNYSIADNNNRYRSVWINKPNRGPLHREVIAYQNDGRDVDHINNEFPRSSALDNRLINLRLATRQENMFNINDPKSNLSTGIEHISWIGKQQGFKVRVNINRKCPRVGWYPVRRYNSKECALNAAKEAALLYKDLLHRGVPFEVVISSTKDRYTIKLLSNVNKILINKGGDVSLL